MRETGRRLLTCRSPQLEICMPDGSASAHLYRPKLATVLQEGYDASAFRKDVMAAVTVAIVALPLSMAIAVASGVSPERGLYAAVIGFPGICPGWQPLADWRSGGGVYCVGLGDRCPLRPRRSAAYGARFRRDADYHRAVTAGLSDPIHPSHGNG